MTELSPEEIRLQILDHLSEFIGKLTQEEDSDATADFASTMADAINLIPISISPDGTITAKLKLIPIDDLLEDFFNPKIN
jgi:hypothetical protein